MVIENFPQSPPRVARQVRLYADIPQEFRVTAETLMRCLGSRDPKWLRYQMTKLERGPRCRAAVVWSDSGLWHFCAIAPSQGELFCFHHGGTAKRHWPPRPVNLADLNRSRDRTIARLEKLRHWMQKQERRLASIDERLRRAATVRGAR